MLIELPNPPQDINDEENVCRHIIFNDWVKKGKDGKAIISAKAFEPVTKTINENQKQVLGLSVTRHINCDHNTLFEIGNATLKERKEKSPERSFHLMGRADIKALKVRSFELDLINTDGLPNHMDMIDWPSPIKSQADLNEIKLGLAMASVLVLY